MKERKKERKNRDKDKYMKMDTNKTSLLYHTVS